MTGHEVALNFGSTGPPDTQIMQDAPSQVFLAADDAHPRKAVDDGIGVANSWITYAIGKRRDNFCLVPIRASST